MNTPIIEGEIEQFRTVIEQVLGLQFDTSKLPMLEESLRRRADFARMAPSQYLKDLEAGAAGLAELNALAADLTVGETYFLRNVEQFNALVEDVLPQRLRARRGSPLNILSAGCSTGEEPYSISIVLHEHSVEAARVSIVGADVNAASIDRARRGRYSGWALRATPPEVRDRWFKSEGRGFALSDAIRSSVKFVHANLNARSALWIAETYDVVFCRNVLMYFAPDQARAVLRRLTNSLAPGGYLFLGHAETLRGLSTDFHLCHSHDTFYYRRKGGPEISAGPVARSASTDAIAGTLSASVGESESWVEAIRLASERVRTLTANGPDRGHGDRSATDPRAPRRWDLARPLLLLQEERFGEALDLVEALPSDATNDPDVSLLLAVLLAHNGTFDRAEAACHRLLEVDELSAGGHYVLALCKEGSGDTAGAIHHDQVAIYLDPGFAMPRVHLGLLARRRNDGETARRELSHAVTLLQSEDSSRSLLFGGGFSREALIALCRSQLAAVGGSA